MLLFPNHTSNHSQTTLQTTAGRTEKCNNHCELNSDDKISKYKKLASKDKIVLYSAATPTGQCLDQGLMHPYKAKSLVGLIFSFL